MTKQTLSLYPDAFIAEGNDVVYTYLPGSDPAFPSSSPGCKVPMNSGVCDECADQVPVNGHQSREVWENQYQSKGTDSHLLLFPLWTHVPCGIVA